MYKQIGCITVFILFLAAGFFVKNNYNQVEPVLYDIGQKIVKFQPNIPFIKTNTQVNAESTPPKTIKANESLIGILGQVPADAKKYQVESLKSEISYTISRRFGKRSSQPVTAVNSNVSGFGWYDQKQSKGLFYVEANAKQFISDNPQMDIDLLNYIANSSISIDGEVGMFVEKTNKQTVNINFNDVIKEIPIEYKLDPIDIEMGYKVNGEFTIKLSDYNIKAPNLKDVYSVDDKVVIKFKLELQSL